MVGLNVALLRRGLRVGSQHLLVVPGRRTGATPDVVARDAARYPVFRVVPLETSEAGR